MSKAFSITVAFLQLLLLVLWEGLGAFYFGWSPWTVFLVWLVGIWSLNILTATVLHTYLKLTLPPVEVPIDVPDITEDDGVG